MLAAIKMKLLFLLLMMTRWTQQSDNDSGSSGMSGCPDNDSDSTEMPEYASGIETTELSFPGLDGVLCNLSVTTTAQCLMDIKMGNISCHVAPDSNTTALCMNQMSTVEHTKTITSTQTVNNPTTVGTYPTPSSSLNEASHPLISSNVYYTECPACAPSTVTTTVYQQQPPIVLSNMTPSCPVCRSSTVTTTISPVVLSAAVQIGILATSAGLICLPILALVIVAYCWVRTHRAVKKKRRDSGMNIDPSAKDSDVNVSATAKLKLNNNPAYETQTPLQKNLAYEDTTLAISKCEESQAITNLAEPAYEIIPLIPIQAASATTQNPSSGEEDGYNKLNRDIVKQK